MIENCSIRVLEEHVIGQIAAGEVVERPASVVKELVENSLDAAARRIDVGVLDGGRKEIRVTDDGHGMSAPEAQICLARHATSKLRAAADLTSVRSLGFRGEGLSSIAAVSRLELQTRQRGSDEGIALQADGGRLVGVEPTGCRAGTTLIVRDIFFNTPARAKFLKSTATEAGHVTDTVNRLGLAFPQVHLSLRQGGRAVVELPSRPARQARVADVLGQAGQLLNGAERELRDWLQVQAYLAPLEQTAATARTLIFVVNGRVVRERMLLQAVLSACDQRLVAGRYPVGVVYLDLAPDALDVNVHPQKSEVRFSDPRATHRLVREVVSELVERHPRAAAAPSRVYKLNAEAAAGRSAARSPDERREQAKRRFWSPPEPPGSAADTDDYGLAAALARHDRADSARSAAEGASVGGPRLVGLVFDRIVLCEWGAQLLLFEQEAGWRCVYEAELTRALELGGAPQVTLSPPVQLSLAAEQSAALVGCLPQLRRLGFAAEPFGRQIWIWRAVPAVLTGPRQDEPEAAPGSDRLERLLVTLIPALVAKLPGSPTTGSLARETSPGLLADGIALLAATAAQQRATASQPERLVAALASLGDPSQLGAAVVLLSAPERSGPVLLSLARADLLRRLAGPE